jgi:hypothetical protein
VSSLLRRLSEVDRELAKLAGLTALPGWSRKADMLLDLRLDLMGERDRGYRVTDRRKITR